MMKMKRILTTATVIVSLAALGACDDDPVDPVEESIAISFSQEDVNIVQGESTAVTVTLTRLGGYDGTVDLSVTGLPEGATATFTPPTLMDGESTSILAIAVAGDAAAGVEPFELAVNADGPGVETASEALLLTIEESEPGALAAH